MQRKILTTKVVVEPKFLGYNIYQVISELLLKQEKGKCSKDTGYIVSIDKNSILILDNQVMYTGNIMFHVKFGADVLKPEKDMVLEATLQIVIPTGIILDVHDMKIFVPRDNLTSNNYLFKDGKYKKNEDDLPSILQVRIGNISYEKQKYRCIADLV